MAVKSILRRIRDAISGVTPNLMPLNYVLAVPKFRRGNGRFPVGEASPDFEFNDFVFWRMIRDDRRSIERVCTDKQFAKIYAGAFPGVRVAETFEVFPVGRDTSVAQFEAFLARHLGKSRVAKPTHSSGPILFLDQDPSREKIAAFFAAAKRDFFCDKRETQYHRLEKKIIVEENLAVHGRLAECKFTFAKGVPLYATVVRDRWADISCIVIDLADLSFVDTEIKGVRIPETFEFPPNFVEMIETARRLAGEFEFVRVDLYEVGGVVYFGEFTFSPSAGNDYVTNKAWARTFARRIVDLLRAG